MAEFIGDPREPEWHRAYIEARNSVRDARGIEIIDVLDASPEAVQRLGGSVAVLIRVLRAADARKPATRTALAADCERQVADGQITIALSPFGAGADAAVDDIFQQVGHPPGALVRWIAAADSLDELRELIANWLSLVADRRFPVPITPGSESVLAEELPMTESATDDRRFRRLRGQP